MKLKSGIPHYFFDETLISHHQHLMRRWHPAKIFPNPVIEPDRPWEGRILCLYGTVLPDPDGGYRMYYSNFTPGQGPALAMLATSDDGFRWAKPELEVVEWGGGRSNNIVVSPQMPMDSVSAMHDPDDPSAPYKIITFHQDGTRDLWNDNWGLYGHTSSDGRLWTQIPGSRLKAGDRTNLMATKPGNKYVAYTRHPDMFAHTGGRAIYRSESEDFLRWTEPELVLAPDFRDEPDVEYYGMSVFERHGWFFGLLEYWRSATDVIETYLVLSRDGKQWMHPEPRAPFIAATYDWNRTWSSCASNGPILIGDQMVFYFGGRWVSHHYDSAQQYGAIGYASLPIDRFCSLEAKSGGLLVTVPLEWPGGDLLLNADTRHSYASHPSYCQGEIAVEVLAADGERVADWSGDQQAVFRGNTHCRGSAHSAPIRWPGDRGLEALRGQTIRLRLHLNHARLFTLEAYV